MKKRPKAKKSAARKSGTAKKPAKSSKPAKTAKTAPPPARAEAAKYTPTPIEGIGWAPFRYPL